MEWHTHFKYNKYEVNKYGVIRNKRTKRQLKIRFDEKNSKPTLNIFDRNNMLRFKFAGVFILEAIDGVPYENVEYLDKDVTNHSYSNLKAIPITARGKRIVQLSLTGEYIKTWKNGASTVTEGFNSSCIYLCCKKRQSQHAGYLWCYEKDISSFEFEVLVAINKDTRIDIGSTRDAYTLVKEKFARCKFDPFRTGLSKYKNSGKNYYGYVWEVERRKINI